LIAATPSDDRIPLSPSPHSMSVCLNPHCQHPQNAIDGKYCASCGQKLVLRDRYRAIDLIGQGGFGKTFRAIDEDKPSKPLCVIKQFFPLFDDREALQKATELFTQEAIALEHLDHPHIPKLLAYFVTEDGSRYLVQEFIDGQNLRQELGQLGYVASNEVENILVTLLGTLEYIHNRGYIHRDLKPENVIRKTSDRSLYLVDFGAAKIVDRLRSNQSGTTIGTPEFMAPEQNWGQAFFSSDLYSLGLTCVHLLTGLSPFNLFDEEDNNWIWHKYAKTTVAPELITVLDKLIQPLPIDRYQNAGAALVALNAPTTPPMVAPSPTGNYRCNCIYTYGWHRKPINAIELSSDGQFLISGDDGGTVALWNLAMPQPIATYCTHHAIWAVAIDPSRKYIASGDKNRRIQVRRGDAVMTSLRELHPDLSNLDSHSGFIYALSFSPDGKMLVSGGAEGQVRLWDIDLAQIVTTFKGHHQAVTAVKFLPPGQIIVSAGADGTVRFWDVTSHQLLKTVPTHTDKIHDLALGGGGKLIVTGSSDRTVKLRELGASQSQTLIGAADKVLSVAVTPTGDLIAAGSILGQICIWDRNGNLAIDQIGHQSAIRSMAFTPDGHKLITASWDSTIKVWQIDRSSK
jgi:serine/threonine protein kinase